MEQHAIIIVYRGTEPCEENIQAAIEAIIRSGVAMESQTIVPTVLNEKDISNAIVRHAVDQINAPTVSQTAIEYDVAFATVMNEIKKDPSIEIIENKYLLSRLQCANPSFAVSVDRLIELTPRRLVLIKRVHEEMGRQDLKTAKNLVDSLYEIFEICRGHTVE